MDTTQSKILQELGVLQSKYSTEEIQLLGSILLMAEPAEDEVQGHLMQNSQVYDIARLHRQDLLCEAQQYRLERDVSLGQPGLGARIGQALGSFLVGVGRRLQGRPVASRPARAAGD